MFSIAAQIGTGIWAGISKKESALKYAKLATYVTGGSVTLGAFVLLLALVKLDYSLEYVVEYTSNALPFLYRIGAMWAGQAGSLLLWAWIVAVSAAWVAYADRRYEYGVAAYSYMVFGLITGLFVFLSFFMANAFAAPPAAVVDGSGLNPLLQDPLQIIHPLMLYGGYVLYAVPFALVVGALLGGVDFNGAWLRQARTWSIVSWIFLTAGIVLGARWAYAELGWGGYWAWDPVENASLIPWLTGTALLHNGVLRRGANRLRMTWSIMMMLTFNLCLFGTFLTRSGVIQSVHAFGESNIGPILGGAILVFVFLSGAVVIWRLPSFAFADTEKHARGWLGQILVGTLLFAMSTAVLFGTMYPLFHRLVLGTEIAQTPAFFRWVVTPMGVALLLLLAVSPFIKDQKADNVKYQALLRGIVFVAVFGAIMLLSEMQNPGVALVISLSVLAAITVVQKALPKVKAARSESHAIWHAIHSTAPYIGHIGLIVMLAGITVNQSYEIQASGQLTVNEAKVIGSQNVMLKSMNFTEHTSATGAIERQTLSAVVAFLDSEGNEQKSIETVIESFSNSESLHTQVGILSSWDRDLYVRIDDPGDAETTLRVTIFDAPGIMWIWFGGFLLSVGGIIYVIPWRRRSVSLAKDESGDVSALIAAAIAATKAGDVSGQPENLQALISTAKQLSGGENASDQEVIAFLEQARRQAPGNKGLTPTTTKAVAIGAVVVAVAAIAYAYMSSNSVPGISEAPTETPSASATAIDPEMVAALEAKIAANPKDTDSMWALVNIYYPASKWEESSKYTKLLTEIDPKNPETWYANARVAQQSKDRQTELDSWLQVIKLEPNNKDFADAYFDLGFWYWSADPQQKDKAVAAWKKLIELDPNSDMAQMVAPHIEAATGSASASPTN